MITILSILYNLVLDKEYPTVHALITITEYIRKKYMKEILVTIILLTYNKQFDTAKHDTGPILAVYCMQ